MKRKTDDQATEHWADAAEAPAAPGLQNFCQPWGAAAEMGVRQYCLWRMGTSQQRGASTNQAGAGDRRAAGQGMSARKRDRQPARHAANA